MRKISIVEQLVFQTWSNLCAKVNRRGDRLQIPCAEVVRDENYLRAISSSF